MKKYAIDASEKIVYNGQTYHIRIRSTDEKNPVVLFLHGGCGSPDRAHVMKYQSPLAEDFTLVAWDQRGSGYAYDKEEAETTVITKDLYTEDANNVVMYLKERFGKEKIIIIGHSFGTVLGVWLALKYPQNIEAYVGIGQCTDYARNETIAYYFTLEEAKRLGDQRSLAVLEEIGCPVDGVYRKEPQKSQMKQRAILHKYGGATYANRKPYWAELLFHDVPILLREYSLRGLVKYVKGLTYLPNTPMAKTNPDFFNTAKSLDVPVYLLLGKHDYNCATALGTEWLEKLNAPKKELVLFDNSAHSPQWEEPDLFNERFRALFR